MKPYVTLASFFSQICDFGSETGARQRVVMIFDPRLGTGFVPPDVAGTDGHILTGHYKLFISFESLLVGV